MTVKDAMTHAAAPGRWIHPASCQGLRNGLGSAWLAPAGRQAIRRHTPEPGCIRWIPSWIHTSVTATGPWTRAGPVAADAAPSSGAAKRFSPQQRPEPSTLAAGWGL